MSHFINSETVTQGFRLVVGAIEAALGSGLTKRDALHVVVLNPGVRFDDPVLYENAVLAERSFGDRASWEHPYDQIAHAKAKLSWRTGLDTHVALQLRPDLIGKGDVVYRGGVCFNGIVVACSGVEAEYDEMFARWIAAAIYGLAARRLEVARTSGESFIA